MKQHTPNRLMCKLLALPLLLATAAPHADIYITPDACGNYAAKAVFQHRSQQAAHCGFADARWSEDGAGQHTWCRTVRPRETDNETQARATLLMKCLNPQGDINPNDLSLPHATLTSEMESAAYRGATERVQQLIAAGADFSRNQATLMEAAIRSGKTGMVGFFQRMGIALSTPGHSPLATYIEYGEPTASSTKMLQWLLSNGADANHTGSDGHTPLQTAIYHQNPKVVALLLRHRANPNLDVNGKNCTTAMHLDSAVDMGNEEVIKLLRNAGAKTQAQCSRR